MKRVKREENRKQKARKDRLLLGAFIKLPYARWGSNDKLYENTPTSAAKRSRRHKRRIDPTGPPSEPLLAGLANGYCEGRLAAVQ